MLFVPRPKEVALRSGSFLVSNDQAIVIPAQEKAAMFPIAKRVQKIVAEHCGIQLPVALAGANDRQRGLAFKKNPSLADDTYLLTVDGTKIEVEYSEPSAAFYGVSTLGQIVRQSGKHIPCLEIRDHPDFEVRAAMLDISRDKIPKLETLFDFVDFMAGVKLNQLQLYIEGFPFAYPSFPQVWQAEDPLTGEDIIELDQYCKDRYVELVPNQNSFGHMGPWLSRREFVHLAEETEGKEAFGRHWKAVLNPLDSRSIEFVNTTYEDLLPNFSSNLFNVGCDEVALGQDKTKEACEEKGAGRVFIDYVKKIYELVQQHGKEMMMWGDVFFEHPEVFDELPKDIVVLDWGYTHDFPYDDHGKLLASKNQPFYVCPGTGSWRSITGRTNNTLENLVNATANGKKHGARGCLITDWGDRGHWQYLPISYPGFVYGAGLSWGVEENEELDIAACLDAFVFQDKAGVMGATMLDLGRYCLRESNPGIFGPNIFSILNGLTPLNDPKSIEGVRAKDLLVLEDYIVALSDKLDSARMGCRDASLVRSELGNATRLLLHGINLSRLKLSATGQDTNVTVDPADLVDDISEIMSTHVVLWLERNRIGGLSRSMYPLEEWRRKYVEIAD
ncbi:MAG: family 20 glycosylhydrolase [Spirochaetaceae bacterium]|nr:family 20 glycosylhydrolase [Spirochaetaceae bacterium]